MSETTLIVIRHGETEWNLQGRWQGHDDSPLTENGIQQTRALAKSLASCDATALYSSDLGRTIQTSEIISEKTGLEIILEPRIRERHLGVFQGLTTSEMASQFPEYYKAYKVSGAGYRVPGGESKRDRYERSIACFNELAAKHKGETILVVTHGGVLNALFRHVVGLSLDAPRYFHIWNTSKNQFSWNQGVWRLLTFGDISHLGDLSTRDDD